MVLEKGSLENRSPGLFRDAKGRVREVAVV